MKRSIIVTLMFLTITGMVWGQKKGKAVTIVGEVVETQCYITGATGPGKGESHKDCALKCASAGIPLSILEDKTGTVYLAGQSKTAMTGANKMLMEFVAQQVKVTGRIFEKGGLKLLMIDSIAKADAKK